MTTMGRDYLWKVAERCHEDDGKIGRKKGDEKVDLTDRTETDARRVGDFGGRK